MDRRHPRNISARPLVLIVDDDDDTRELYVQSLTALGFETIDAEPASACERAWEFHPDIVVSELMFRRADGWQIVQGLRREARTRDIPVVVLTSYVAPASRERAQREGCAKFLVKPCLPDDLATEIRQVLARTGGHEHVRNPPDGDTKPCSQ